MSARRVASSVFCEPLPTHLVQPPLIPKRMIAASASTTTGINFFRHPLLVDTLFSTAGVVLSEDGAVLFGLSEVAPLLLGIGSTVVFGSCGSGMFTCPLPDTFQTPPSLSRTRATPVGIHDSLQPAMPETEARLKAKRLGACSARC